MDGDPASAMLEQGGHKTGAGPDVVRVVIGDTGICLDIVMVDGVRAAPSIACIVVAGKDLGELRVSLRAPQELPEHAGPPLDGRGDPAQTVRVAVQGASPTPLSPREMEVLSHLAAGQSNKVIAQAMNISGETVRAHVKSIFRKAGLENRTQAALWAMAVTSSEYFQHMQEGAARGEAPDVQDELPNAAATDRVNHP
jgi:DNA-binding CsgD family transcriptional regulator